MKRLLLFAMPWLATLTLSAADGLAGLPGVTPSPTLQAILNLAVADTVERFSEQGVTTNQLAATVVDLTNPDRLVSASYRGDVLIYPASVVKLFYLAAAHRWLEDGKLTETPELRRALQDMIVESYNEATHYVLDLLTGTTSGPELSDEALTAWVEQRKAVNRYFQSLGYPNINASKKPWSEGPYGRETQAIQRFEPKRNFLTTDATARLMLEIATGRAVSEERSQQMLNLLRRDVYGPVKDPEDQTHGFTGIALLVPWREGVKLWSKAGWTSETRHDAAYLEFPDGRKLVVVVFTTDHAKERGLIPSIVRPFLEPVEK